MPERTWDVSIGVEDHSGEDWEVTVRVVAPTREDAMANALGQAQRHYFHTRSVTARDAVAVLPPKPD